MVGSTLQFAVQVPVVLRVAPDLRVAFDLTSQHVRAVGRNFLPVFISRGVVQVSAYIDALLASLLPTGAVTGISTAALLYTLPVSLFGVSVAAVELPAMSGLATLDAAGAEALRARLDAVRARTVGKKRVPGLIVIDSDSSMVAGKDTFLSELFEIAGGTNVAAETPPSS